MTVHLGQGRASAGLPGTVDKEERIMTTPEKKTSPTARTDKNKPHTMAAKPATTVKNTPQKAPKR